MENICHFDVIISPKRSTTEFFKFTISYLSTSFAKCHITTFLKIGRVLAPWILGFYTIFYVKLIFNFSTKYNCFSVKSIHKNEKEFPWNQINYFSKWKQFFNFPWNQFTRMNKKLKMRWFHEKFKQCLRFFVEFRFHGFSQIMSLIFYVKSIFRKFRVSKTVTLIIVLALN